MDPATIALTLLLKSPVLMASAASAAHQAMAPGAVDVISMQRSFADLSKGVLLCYHKTARFSTSDLLQTPWVRQGQYAADNSAVLRIHYSGVSTAPYQMVVAVMVKQGKVRSAVIADSALVSYSKKCQLEEWT